MRERWFGATGRKVPEIALDGMVDLAGALVLDDVSDVAAIHAAHHVELGDRSAELGIDDVLERLQDGVAVRFHRAERSYLCARAGIPE